MTDGLIARRHLLAAGAALSAASAFVPEIAAAATAAAQSAAFSPQPVPLPFDPKAISGLSEKLLTSHHDNNYVGAVKRLGTISGQIAALDAATAPGFVLNGLKREELIAWNSMIVNRRPTGTPYRRPIGTPLF